MQIKFLLFSVILSAVGGSASASHDFSGAYLHPNIPAAKEVEIADPGQVNTFCASNLPCTVSAAWTFSSSLTVSGTATLLNPNNIIHVEGLTGRTLAQGIALCPAGTGGCEVDVDSTPAAAYTAPITLSQADNNFAIRCLGGSDVNGNPGGTLITYSPTTSGTAFITFSNSTRDRIIGCNITQGNTQANTTGVVFQGVQGGRIENSQIYGFTLSQYDITDSATSSGEYNTCFDSHFIGLGPLNIGQFGVRILSTHFAQGFSANQNIFYNCTARLATTNSILYQGIASENGWFGGDASGNATTLVSIGDGANAARDNIFDSFTLESAVGSIASSPTGAVENGAATVATITTTGAHALSTGQTVAIAGVGNSCFNLTGVITVTGRTTFTVPNTACTANATSGSGTVTLNNMVGFALNGAAMARIWTEGGLVGAGSQLVTVANGATYDLHSGSSAGVGGSRWAVSTPFFSIDGPSGSIGMGLSTNPGGTPATFYGANGMGFAAGGTTIFQLTSSGSPRQMLMTGNAQVNFGTSGGSVAFANPLFIGTAPTIAAAGCGGAAASISANNGTADFVVNVGTTPGSACTITMPTATNAWSCTARDNTTTSASVYLQKQTSSTASQVVITNFNTSAAATAFVASDALELQCTAR